MEGGDGLLQRFQFMVYPKLSKEMGVNRQPDLDLKEKPSIKEDRIGSTYSKMRISNSQDQES